jgi:hypothetical protein
VCESFADGALSPFFKLASCRSFAAASSNGFNASVISVAPLIGNENGSNLRRAHAGSSRRLDQHGAAVETAVLLALTPANTRKDFSMLLRELAPAVSQSGCRHCIVAF